MLATIGKIYEILHDCWHAIENWVTCSNREKFLFKTTRDLEKHRPPKRQTDLIHINHVDLSLKIVAAEWRYLIVDQKRASVETQRWFNDKQNLLNRVITMNVYDADIRQE